MGRKRAMMSSPPLKLFTSVLYLKLDEHIETKFPSRQSGVTPPDATVTTVSEPLMSVLPPTCRRELGMGTPMPTLVSAVAPLSPLTLPSTRLLFAATKAFAPIAVAFVRLLLKTSAPAP